MVPDPRFPVPFDPEPRFPLPDPRVPFEHWPLPGVCVGTHRLAVLETRKF